MACGCWGCWGSWLLWAEASECVVGLGHMVGRVCVGLGLGLAMMWVSLCTQVRWVGRRSVGPRFRPWVLVVGGGVVSGSGCLLYTSDAADDM
eukprot:6440829-Alexandrium_andersonii.AAC.1